MHILYSTRRIYNQIRICLNLSHIPGVTVARHSGENGFGMSFREHELKNRFAIVLDISWWDNKNSLCLISFLPLQTLWRLFVEKLRKFDINQPNSFSIVMCENLIDCTKLSWQYLVASLSVNLCSFFFLLHQLFSTYSQLICHR